jgi:hypothetical protein
LVAESFPSLRAGAWVFRIVEIKTLPAPIIHTKHNDELQDPRARAQGGNDSATKHSQQPTRSQSKNKRRETGRLQVKEMLALLYFSSDQGKGSEVSNFTSKF